VRASLPVGDGLLVWWAVALMSSAGQTRQRSDRELAAGSGTVEESGGLGMAYLLTHFWVACDEFVQKLMSAMPIEGGLVGPPQERGAEIVNSVGLPA
jgi:hypothetical protein